MRKLLLSITFLALAAPCSAQWRHYPGFSTVGLDGMAIGDFDGDGDNELAYTAKTTALNYGGVGAFALGVVSRNGASYRRDGISLHPNRWTSPLIVKRFGARDHVFTQYPVQDGTGHEFVELAGIPLRPVRTVASSLQISLSAVVDVDDDGSLEFVGRAGYDWYASPVIVDASSGEIEWLDTTSANGLSVAQLDNDPALELIIGREQGMVLDGATRAIEWTYPAGFGAAITTGIFSPGDTTQFAAVRGNFTAQLTLFRGSPYSPLREFEIERSPNIQHAIAHDIDDDGVDELLMAGGQWDQAVHAYDTVDGSQTAFPGDNVEALAAGEIGPAAVPSLAMARSVGIGLESLLRIIDIRSGATDFAMDGAQGPFSAIAVGNFEGNGADSLVFGLSGADGSGMWRSFCRLHLSSGRPQQCLDALDVPVSWYPDRAPVVGQFDTDAADEFASIDGSAVVIFDGATLEPERRFQLPDGISEIRAIDGLDFDQDGRTDVVAVTHDSKIIVVSGRDGQLLWTSVTLGNIYGGYRPLVRVGNADEDPAPEIVVSSPDAIYAFDSQTRLLDWTIMTANSVSMLSIWGEGNDCRVSLDGSALLALDVHRCGVQKPIASIAIPENTRAARPLDSAGTAWLIAAEGRLLTLEDGDWRAWTGYLGFDLGAGDNLIVLPRASGGIDAVIGSDALVTRIRVDPALVFEDAFENTAQ